VDWFITSTAKIELILQVLSIIVKDWKFNCKSIMRPILRIISSKDQPNNIA
jgi:hypothetical protein